MEQADDDDELSEGEDPNVNVNPPLSEELLDELLEEVRDEDEQQCKWEEELDDE